MPHNIPVQQARGIFTRALVDSYRELPRPSKFLQSFFRIVESETKTLFIEVQRGSEKVAVDVKRGTEGNRNTFSLSSEKEFLPPYYREFFDATSLDFYDRLFGMGQSEVSVETMNMWISRIQARLMELEDKITRALEVQCAQALLTGIITLVNGDNIDYKRKAASIVADLGAGNYWDLGTSDPTTDLETGATFIRTEGKTESSVYDVLLGQNAFSAFQGNATVQARADIRNFKLDDLNTPQRNAVGAAFHGQVSGGSYNFNLWTYPQFRDVSGVSTPYIPTDQVIILPQNPRFTLGFAAVPKLFRDMARVEFPQWITPTQGMFVIGNYVDERAESHIFDIKSAGIAQLNAVDQVFTMDVFA